MMDSEETEKRDRYLPTEADLEQQGNRQDAPKALLA
jgi:hypothetical protein